MIYGCNKGARASDNVRTSPRVLIIIYSNYLILIYQQLSLMLITDRSRCMVYTKRGEKINGELALYTVRVTRDVKRASEDRIYVYLSRRRRAAPRRAAGIYFINAGRCINLSHPLVRAREATSWCVCVCVESLTHFALIPTALARSTLSRRGVLRHASP